MSSTTRPCGGLNAEDERQFLAAMHSRGLALETGNLIANGEWQSCSVVAKGRAGKGDGRMYACGRSGAVGVIHNWTDGKDPDHWRGDRNRNLTEAETKELEIRMEQVRIEHARIAAKEAEAAAREASRRWARAREADHVYLRKKGIKAHGVRVEQDGCLLVPIHPDNKLANLQIIHAAA